MITVGSLFSGIGGIDLGLEPALAISAFMWIILAYLIGRAL